MYLYVVSNQLSNANSDEERDRAKQTLLKQLVDCGENASLKYIDIGRGASADAIKIILDWLPALTPIAIFFLGSQIEKNLDAWMSIAKRLNPLIRKLRRMGHYPIVTFEAACAIALDEIVKNKWHEPEFEIEHIVLSNKYAKNHTAFPSMEELKEFIDSQRRDDFDPLAGEAIYTFFGRCSSSLFMVSIDCDGSVLVTKQLF